MKFKEMKEGTKTKFKRRRKKSRHKSSGRNQDMKVKEEREEIKKVSMAQGFTEKHPTCPRRYQNLELWVSVKFAPTQIPCQEKFDQLITSPSCIKGGEQFLLPI